ncbi:MAG TPA: DUF4388 domain-containing protein [Pyrinomonadaceae bacterium]|jgi:curved DNA-binding protein CbpA|nr:DUF4388 domain-containing protein [Pyrinomonadaceae bacterium]
MDGQLRDYPLAELIHEISDARLSGALRLTRERVRAVVYFEAGQTVAALMNLRAMRLAEVLRRSGAVEAERLAGVIREEMSEEQAEAALVRSGLLAGAELKKFQRRRSSEVLCELLRWSEVEWRFDPRVRLGGGQRASLNTPQLLVEAARALPDETVARRMGDEGETIAPAGVAEEKAEGGVQLLPAEAFVLSRVVAPMSLGELFAISGLPEDETRRAVYVLALGGLLERGRWPRSLSESIIRKASPRPDAPAKEQLPQADDAPQEAQASPAEAALAESDSHAALEELLERARGATHYVVLGVARSAPSDEIKRAYYSLARRLHPDRFRRDADEPLRQQTDAAFARIAQAYEVLKDSGRRAAYDLKLSKQPEAAPRVREGDAVQETVRVTGSNAAKRDDAATRDAAQSPPASPLDAEQKFQQGMAALRRDDVARARAFLGEAARLVPQQARYRAYFGQALAHDRATRRQAESELQSAIALDAGNASYHVMLAELYAEVGLRRKAEAELERALALDPAHAAARRLVEELRRAG